MMHNNPPQWHIDATADMADPWLRHIAARPLGSRIGLNLVKLKTGAGSRVRTRDPLMSEQFRF
jgi:hypothetical protein